MLKDIHAAKSAGAHGVAIGALDRSGLITGAYDTIRVLVRQAKCLGLKVTFHRAFDVAADPEEGVRVCAWWCKSRPSRWCSLTQRE